MPWLSIAQGQNKSLNTYSSKHTHQVETPFGLDTEEMSFKHRLTCYMYVNGCDYEHIYKYIKYKQKYKQIHTLVHLFGRTIRKVFPHKHN